jgi:predicted dehydrogenase
VELTELARRGGREIVMSYPNSYTAHTRRAKEAVAAGEIGEIEMVSSLFSSDAYETYRGDTATLDRFFGPGSAFAPIVRPRDDANTEPGAGGQGYCQVTHSAALMLLVTGLAVERVSAFMSRLDVRVDVVDAINMRMTNGAVGVAASTGHIRPGDPGEHTLAVYGSSGWLLLDMVAGTLAIKRFDGSEEKRNPLPAAERFPRFAPANNLVDIILHGAENLAPGELGSATVFFLDAAYKSAANGGAPADVYRPPSEV